MYRFLNKCAQVEATTAQIYHEFAGNKKCDQTLSAIWSKMARDEEDHAQQLGLAMRLLRNNSINRIRTENVDIDEMNSLASSVLTKARKESYELLDMLKDAVVLENSFRKIHATYAIEFSDPSLLVTFRHLAHADELHLKELKAYLERYKEERRAGSTSSCCGDEPRHGQASTYHH